jgi:hypothetical protein
MPTKISIHSTGKSAGLVLLGSLLVVAFIVGVRRTPGGDSGDLRGVGELGLSGELTPSNEQTLLPVIKLDLVGDDVEVTWSRSLARKLGGETEFAVEGGRVDVLTENFAIEVDRVEKWHEAIGQAAHYGLKTGRLPVVAIYLPSDLWPLNSSLVGRLRLIDETCIKQGIKLVLLVSS